MEVFYIQLITLSWLKPELINLHRFVMQNVKYLLTGSQLALS